MVHFITGETITTLIHKPCLKISLKKLADEEVASTGNQNTYRLAALQDAEVTRLTRFCKEIYIAPTTTLVP